jgi:hypothetical protein
MICDWFPMIQKLLIDDDGNARNQKINLNEVKK